HTSGFDKLVPHVKPFTPEWAQDITWVPADQIRKLARLFANTKGASIFQGTCTHDQTANGTQNSRAFAVLQAITGNINVPGGWVTCAFPRFGDMSLPFEAEPLGYEQYPMFVELWGRKTPYGVVTMVPEAIPEKLKAFLVVGGNPLVSMPDSNAFTEAFRRLDLLVVHDMFMTETAREAHYVLPACSHLEKWGVAYTYNVCHSLPYLMLRKQAIPPLGESWSERRLFCELAARLGLGELFPWQSDEELVSYLLEPSGLSFDYLLNQRPEGDFYTDKKYAVPEGLFRTPSGKIEIYSPALAELGFDPLPAYVEPERGPRRADQKFLKKYPLILSTGARNLYYTHSQQRQSQRLSKASPEPFAEIGPATASEYGLSDRDLMEIETNRGRVRMKVKVQDKLAEKVVLVPHGWAGDANANLLTDVHCRETIMGYPDMKSLMCAIRKVQGVAAN
ncbi:MAG: molybdopterin-dependent oxidoreductase, partial [Desulfarculaceae bacterium]